MTLKVARQLWTLLTLHIIDLCELPVPKECKVFTAVNSFDVHAQCHNTLVVCVRGGLIFESHLYCFVGYLHHFKVILHLLL